MERVRASIRLGFLLVPLAALGGCGGDNPYFSDDEGAERPSAPLGGDHPDELSLPYALGTSLRVVIQGADDKPVSTWSVESTAPAVVSVEKFAVEDKKLVADLKAKTEGDARIRLVDGGGKELRSAAVSVKAPDRARVLSHSTMRLLGRGASSIDPAEVKQARVAVGGTGTYAIMYLNGSQRVFGRGILAVEAPASVKAEDRTTQGVTTNEWLFVTPSAAGDLELKLSANGRALVTLPLAAVPDTDATAIAIAEETVKDRKDGTEIWLFARATDAMGRAIDGVYADWTLDGLPQIGKDGDATKKSGDLLRYAFKSGAAPRDVVAKHGALSATTRITAEKAWVMDTTYLGCSAGGHHARPGLAGFALLGLAALLTLRRRARPTAG